MVPYVIRQGDYLAQLAHALGFDEDVVWDDPANAALKASRDKNMLYPGDVLYIPEPKTTPTLLSGGSSNEYAASIPTTTIKLTFTDNGKPVANEACVVEGLGEPRQATTDGDGLVSIDVPVDVKELQIRFEASQITYPVHIGAMDPVDEAAGVRKRLQNLGFYVEAPPGGTLELADDEMDAADKDGLAAFQAVSGLEPTGILDDATKAELLKRHGC
jgi:N-acetylmuramoyl-L-alanine amidase